MNIFAQITKIDAAKREIHGVMAEEAPDKAGEIFDYATSKPYVKEWSDEAKLQTSLAGQDLSMGNVRSQHNPKIAAGKLTSIDFDDDAKKILVIARIVDDGEWSKVQEGVYTGFSIGGQYVKRWSDGRHTRYTARPTEVSIVDSPCMAGATFSMVKVDGAVEQRRFRTEQRQVNSHDPAALVKDALVNPLRTVADLEKSEEQRGPKFVPQGFGAPGPNEAARDALRKALATPLSGAELEKAQESGGRTFVTRGPQPLSASNSIPLL